MFCDQLCSISRSKLYQLDYHLTPQWIQKTLVSVMEKQLSDIDVEKATNVTPYPTPINTKIPGTSYLLTRAFCVFYKD